jgi:Flp pilus assembly protein TadG
MRMIDLHRCNRGAEIAEMALLLPLLCFICFGIIEVSSFVRVHQVINNAAREGARLSSLPENLPSNSNPDPTPQIKAAVATYAQQNGLSTFSAGNVAIDQNQIITTASGENFFASRVTVTFPYSVLYIPGMIYSTMPGTVNLKATAEFRNFQ